MEKTQTPRLFLALEATDLVEELKPWLKKMRKTADHSDLDVRWVREQSYHLTSVFLGATPRDSVPALAERLREAVTLHPSFELRLEGLDAFPEPASGRVIWIGARRSRGWVALRHMLASVVWGPENRLTDESDVPHLTLGRLKNPRHVGDFLSPFQGLKLRKMKVKRVVLYESILAGPFPVYEPLATFDLAPEPVSTELTES